MIEAAIVTTATICITIALVTALFTVPGNTALLMTLAGALGAVIARYVPKLTAKIRGLKK